MDQSPPPLENPNTVNQAPPAQGGGGGKCAAGCGIGCLVVVLICVALGVGAYFWVKTKVGEGVENFTTDTPVMIEAPDVNQQQIDLVINRFDEFAGELSANEATEPLILTGQDLNILLHHHPDFSEMAGMASVDIVEDLLTGQVSIDLESLNIPIKFIAEQVEGRYFNGEGSFRLNMAGGRPALYLEALEVNDTVIPDIYVQEMKKENLFKDIQDSPEMKEFFDKLQDLKVEDGKLYVVPK